MYIDECNAGCDSFMVSTFNCDHEYRSTPVFFLEICQEMSSRHCQLKNISIRDLNRQSKTWVLNRLSMVIYGYPQLSDEITAKTAMPLNSGKGAYRFHSLFDGDGNLLAAARDRFAVLDINTRESLPVDEICRKVGTYTDDCSWARQLEGKDRRFDIDFIKSMELYGKYSPEILFEDSDYNGHVNHIVYFRWMIASMEKNMMLENKPCYIDIFYHKEIHMTDKVSIEVRSENSFSYYYIVRKNNSDEIACIGHVVYKVREKQ